MSYEKILVPVVPGSGDEAQPAIDVARTLLAPGGRITVISVFEDLPRYLAVEAIIEVATMEENREATKKDLVDRFESEDVDVVFTSGNPTRQILDAAEEGGHGCIVIASAQPGWQRLFLGSTASGVVRHARCSVHVLR